MMIGKSFLMSLCVPGILSFAQTSQAFCIKSKTDFEKYKSQLPPIFQNLPVMLTYRQDNIYSAVSLRFLDTGGIRIEGSGCKKVVLAGMMCQDDDDADVSQLCYDNSKYKISLATGTSFDGRVVGESVFIKDYPFKRVDFKDYASMMQKMGKESKMPAGTSGGQN